MGEGITQPDIVPIKADERTEEPIINGSGFEMVSLFFECGCIVYIAHNQDGLALGHGCRWCRVESFSQTADPDRVARIWRGGGFGRQLCRETHTFMEIGWKVSSANDVPRAVTICQNAPGIVTVATY